MLWPFRKKADSGARAQAGGATISSILDAFSGGDIYDSTLLLNGRERPISRDIMASYSAVYRCATLCAGAIAGLPIYVFDKNTGKRVDGGDSPAGRLADLFEGGMDSDMPTYEFFETIILDMALDGNFYAKIERDGIGRLERLKLLLPHQADVVQSSNGMLVYGLLDEDGDYHRLAAADVLHGKMPRVFNRYIGNRNHRRYKSISPAYAIHRAVSTGLMGDDYVRRHFTGEDLQSNIAIMLKGDYQSVTKEQRNSLLAFIKKSAKERMPIVLPDADVKSTAVPAQDSNLAKLREFQIEEIGRAYGIPSPLLGVNVSTWGKGIEELSKLFLRYSLRHYMERIESVITFNLLPRGFKVRFDEAELTRGDLATTGGFVRNVVGGPQAQGIITTNEAREKFMGLPPVEGGDKLYVPDGRPMLENGKANGHAAYNKMQAEMNLNGGARQ